MNTNYTKGEWRTSKMFDEITVSREGILEGSKCICKITEFGKEEYERVANAKLIAAAPKLLEALIEYKRMYEEIQPSGGWQGIYEIGNYAIKKATE